MILADLQHRGSLILFAFVFSLSQCVISCIGAQPNRNSNIGEYSSKPRISIPQLEKRIHTLVNNERRRYGLTALAWDDALAGIASKHSYDMEKRKYFAHTTPEGFDFSYRFNQAGYRCTITEGTIIYAGAENLMLNNLYNSVTTVNGNVYYDWNSLAAIAETTVKGWMQSPGHKKNILTPQWRHEGIGVAISPDDKVYITQNFC